MIRHTCTFLGLAALVAPLCAQSVTFTEQTALLDETGVPSPPFSSGLALGVVDLNGDGRDDIIRLHNIWQLSIEYQASPGSAFSHNLIGAITTGVGWSISVADVDENGFNDILIGGNSAGGHPAGFELFTADSTGASYTSTMVKTGGVIVQGAIFADLDQDHDLDIFACDDVADMEEFSNDGLGNFTADTSLVPTSFANPFNDSGNYAILGTDYDNDGDIDYYLSKCQAREGSALSLRRINRLFENDGTGSYSEPLNAAGLDDGNQSWTADFGDVDNDGDLDCFVLNHQFSSGNSSGPSGPSLFYTNNGNGTFTESTVAAGLTNGINFMGAQCLFRDFNNDGWVDLLVSSLFLSNYAYFLNDGDGTFTKQTGAFQHAAGAGEVAHIQSFAAGDLNRDGFLDLYASRGSGINYPTDLSDILFFNGGNANKFLSVRLEGDASCRNGIGARLEVHGPFAAGGAAGKQIREVRGGEGYGIMNSLNTHFGLGSETEVEKVVVRWPSGTVDEILNHPADRFFTVYEGTGKAAYQFGDWIAQFYPGGGPDAEADADPDNDKIPSIIEQIIGTPAGSPSAMKGFAIEVIDDGGQDFLQVTLDREPTVGIAMEFEFSTDGIDWQPDPGLVVLSDTIEQLVVCKAIDPATEPVWLVRLRAESTL